MFEALSPDVVFAVKLGLALAGGLLNGLLGYWDRASGERWENRKIAKSLITVAITGSAFAFMGTGNTAPDLALVFFAAAGVDALRNKIV